jgi:protein-disulfide isomerase
MLAKLRSPWDVKIFASPRRFSGRRLMGAWQNDFGLLQYRVSAAPERFSFGGIMRKFVLTVLLSLSVCAATSARAQQQPQRGTTSAPARPATAQPAKPASTPPAKPVAATPTPTPASAAKADDCGCEVETQPDVLAVVNGVKIASKEINEPINERIQRLQQSVVDARKHELDLQINSMLLDAEAKRRGKTTTQLLQEEIVSKTTEPTEAEARAFYDQNKAQIQGAWSAELKDQIVQYLREQRQQEQAKKFADQLRATAQVKMSVTEATPPATVADRARVFATVNGANVTSAMVEDSIKPLVYNVQRQVYTLRKQQLDTRINDVLLEQEAQKRQVTTKSILDTEITSKTKPVTETEARAFYDQNKERINGGFDQVKDQIVQYLQDQQRQSILGALAERLRSAATVQTFLREPAAPVYQISTDDQPSRGSVNAPVTLVEFTDYQCPSCAGMEPVLERIVTEYGERVRLVVRDFPLTQHANAFKAAEAAEAARAQGKYWEYTKLLFANQQALDVPKLKEYATQLGLDRQKFDAMLDSGQLSAKIQSDLNDGARLGVDATPTIFVNGRPLLERSYDGLKAMVDAALKEKGSK